MSGNNESGGGCAAACGERCRDCLSSIRNLPLSGEPLHSCLIKIRDFPFCLCCLCFISQLDAHILASVALFGGLGFTIGSWIVLSLNTSLSASAYCFVMIICAGMSRLIPRGRNCIRKVQKEIADRRQREDVDQPSRELSDGAEPVELDDPNIVYQGPDVAPAPERRHRAEVYIADQPSESSYLGEPASMSSDEPSQQAAASESGSNLPPSSTDPSTPSTSTTPLE